MDIPSRLMGVAPMLRLTQILWEKHLTSTIPVHRANQQALRVLPFVVVWSIPKPEDQQPLDPLRVPGVLQESLEHKLGPTQIERVRDRHLWSFGPVRGVYRSRRHNVVAANPVRYSVLVDQVGPHVGFENLVGSFHLRVELVLLGVVAQVNPVTTGHRHPERAGVLFIVPLVPGLRLGNRVPHLGEQGLERLQRRVHGLGHRLARIRSHAVPHPRLGEVSQAPRGDQVHGRHTCHTMWPPIVRLHHHRNELVPVVF